MSIIKNHCLFRHLLMLFGFVCLWFCSSMAGAEPADYWLLVDHTSQRVVLYRGDNRVVKQFANISIGRAGVSQLHFKGDDTTPIGEYQVTHINLNSRFRAFIGLNYPTPTHAKQAFLLGKISAQELNSLLEASRKNSSPPTNTSLGGMIGIHALGVADPKLHTMANWTEGCVAINNNQMDELLPYIHEGMRVVIR